MLQKRLLNVCYFIVNIIFGVIIVYLWLLCGFSTCHISLSEHTYFVKDNFFVNIMIAGMLCVILLVLSKRENVRNRLRTMEDEAFLAKIERILLFLIIMEGFIIILSFRSIPRADQSDVMCAAYALKNGDYTPFQPDGYISVCSNQIGLLWFWYILSFVFGDKNYLVFQLINVFAIALIYKQLWDISELLKLPKMCRVFILLFGIFYLPLLFYSTFAYGNIIAQMLAMVSLKYEMVFMKQPRMKYVFLSAAALMLSVAMKENNLIFAVAMVIYAVLKLIETKEAKILILMICMIAGIITQAYFLEYLLEAKTGEHIGGKSMWSFVAMGLHDNEEFCDGWWDGSNDDTYQESGYNADEQKKIAIADIQNRLQELNADKRYALRFFARKIASQWNNPTFQCFWINQTCGSDVEHSKWTSNVLSIQYSEFITGILNIVQFLILSGVVLSVLLSKENSAYILLKVIFIGGFLFHMVWEAKCQYALPYFVVLFPVSMNGYWNLLVYRHKCMNPDGKRGRWNICLFGVLIILVVLINSRLTNSPIKLDFDAEVYEQYIYNNTSDFIREGYYNIKVYKEPELILSYTIPDKDADEGIVFTDEVQESLLGNVKVQNTGGTIRIQFTDSEYFLELDGNDEQRGRIRAYEKNKDESQDWFLRNESQDWFLKKAEGERHTYYIIKGNGALTYDEKNGTVLLGRRDYSDLQKWIIE